MKIDELNLTNDAKYLISKMYSEYLEKRKSGKPKSDARSFFDIETVHKLMPEWSADDVLDTCWELKVKGLLNGSSASNSLIYISMTTDAIAILESSFKDKVNEVLEYVTKIKNLIPFI